MGKPKKHQPGGAVKTAEVHTGPIAMLIRNKEVACNCCGKKVWMSVEQASTFKCGCNPTCACQSNTVS